MNLAKPIIWFGLVLFINHEHPVQNTPLMYKYINLE